MEIREEDLMMAEDTGVEEPPLDEGTVEEADMETPERAPVVLTPDQMPDLEGLEIGDVVTMTVTNITDDGAYELTPEPPAVVEEETMVEEEVPGGGGGTAAIEQALL